MKLFLCCKPGKKLTLCLEDIPWARHVSTRCSISRKISYGRNELVSVSSDEMEVINRVRRNGFILASRI